MMRILWMVLTVAMTSHPVQSATYSTLTPSIKSKESSRDLKSTYPRNEIGTVKSTQQNPQSDNIKTTTTANPAYELRLRDDVIYLTPQICRSLLIDYKMPKDVAYKPGVDVYGNPVKKADLNESPIKAPKSIRIPIQYSKISQNSSASPSPVPNTAFLSDFIDEIPLGFIDFDIESGEIKFNGQNLTNDNYRLIRQKCRDIME